MPVMPERETQIEEAPPPLSAEETSAELPAAAHEPPPWAAVLRHFYDLLGRPLPAMARLEASQLPAPCRQLLAHNHDMTPTLERFYGERLTVDVKRRERGFGIYLREVVLGLERSGRRVAYGAIGIYSDRFTERVRRMIFAEEHPFGRILQMEGIAHLGWPQAFFRLSPDAHIKKLLNLYDTQPLYGRRNVLLDGHRRLLADVMEILGPAPATIGPD